MRKMLAAALLMVAFLATGCADSHTDYPVTWRQERDKWWDSMPASEQTETCTTYFSLDNAAADQIAVDFDLPPENMREWFKEKC